MKKFLSKHLNTIFILGTLLLILGIGIGNNELYNVWRALGKLSVPWLALCVGAFGLHLFLDALTVHYFLRRRHHPITLPYSLFIALMGLYYADVTPGASGGQPMQVYYLKKRNVPIGVSSSALTVKFFCFQLMLLLIGAVAWICKASFVTEQLWGNRWFLILGYVFNALSVTLVLLMAINKRMVRFFIALFIRIGHKLHICKDVHRSTIKWEAILSSFHASVTLIRKRPGELLVLLFISGLQVIALMLITVCVYFALGLSGANIGDLITLALLLYISAAYTPLPGGSGAQEGGFIIYFKNIFPADSIFTGMLLWRFFTFYANLIGGSLVTIFLSGYNYVTKKNEPQSLLEDAEKEPLVPADVTTAQPKKKLSPARQKRRKPMPKKKKARMRRSHTS